MIWRALALLLVSTAPILANDLVELEGIECPYGDRDVPSGYEASCSRMAWAEDNVDYRTQIAVIAPTDGSEESDPILYVPGGPGDAPVNKGADVASILDLFPDHTVITLNPRGVKGAEPRPQCEFDEDFWDEDVTPEREDEMVAMCRDMVDIDLARLDAPYLARDLDRLIGALSIESAGVFAISYGTESALHLLDRRPDWLGTVILDSVSMPGALGATERLEARDRFLGVVDRLCFAEQQCAASIVKKFDDLLDWIAQFDDNPLEIRLGPPKKHWSLESQDMLDFLSSLASYPDGAGYAPLFIEAFEASRDDTGAWVKSELENSFEYAAQNFAVLYGAFSDSAERNDDAPLAGSTRYPFNVEEQGAFGRLFQVWNREDRTESRFINGSSKPEPVDAPVLVLSGGVDSLTPVEWSLELEKRFTGLTHFVFPELAHAVAFGTDSDVEDSSVALQLRCGPRVVRAFIAQKPYGECAQFLRKKKP